GARQNEGDVQQPGEHLEAREALLMRELAERVNGGMGEIELKSSKVLPQRFLRNLAAFLIDDGCASPCRARRSVRVPLPAYILRCENFLIRHGPEMGNGPLQHKLRHPVALKSVDLRLDRPLLAPRRKRVVEGALAGCALLDGDDGATLIDVDQRHGEPR